MSVKIRRKQTARVLTEQQVGYLYRRVTANAGSADIGVVTSQSSFAYLGVLPQDACPTRLTVRVNTIFDQQFVIGSTLAAGSSNAFATTSDLAGVTTAAATYVIDRGYGIRNSTGDTSLYIFCPTAATTGQADVWLEYLPAK